jgi:glutamate dehydrogenase
MFALRQLWSIIEALDNQLPADLQITMLSHSQRLLERAGLWLLRHRRPPLDIAAMVAQFSAAIATLNAELPNLLQAAERDALQAACQTLLDAGAPADLARWVASLDTLYSALDLVEVTIQTGLPVTAVAVVYFGLVSHLELNWLRQGVANLPTANHWQNRARAALLNGLYEQGRVLTADVLRLTAAEDTPERRLATWLEHNHSGVERCRNLFSDLRSAPGPLDLAMLSVAVREVAHLAQ